MKTSKLKKMFSVVLLSFFSSFVAVNITAQEIYAKQNGEINRVDNTYGLLVIDDQTYKLRLGTKVYDINKKIVTRYALEAGQNVFFEAVIENKVLHLNYIAITK